MRRSEFCVLVLVESEDHFRPFDDNRSPDQVRVRHHQIDRFLLRRRQRPFLEDRAARAHEVEKAVGVDVFFQELPRRWFLVDVELLHVHARRVQKTSGVLAGRSSGLGIEGRLRHRVIIVRQEGSRAEGLVEPHLQSEGMRG